MWLEFDTSCNEKSFPDPNIWMKSSNTHLEMDHIASLYSLLSLDCETSKNQYKQIQQYHEKILPLNLHIFYIGFMLARPQNPIKIFTKGEPLKDTAHLKECLLHMGYFKIDPLIHLLNSLQPHIHHFALSIDIAEKLSPRIGIECYAKGTSLKEMIENWEKLGNLLYDKGMMSRKHVLALLQWIGGTAIRSSLNLSEAVYTRTISHIKIVYQEGKALESKIYFAGQQYV